jgi:hypothetical protein
MKKQETLFGSRTAFSAVIASLILMLLAVAAGVVVYAYVMGWIGGATQSPQRQGQVQFDSLYADASKSRITAYIRNVGGVDLLLSKIYVTGVEKANATAIPSAGVTLSVQSVALINVTNTMTKSYFYELAVVCKDGTSISQSVQAK